MGNTRGVIHVYQRRIARFEQQLCVVVAADTDINARAGVTESGRRLAGVFERLPTHLQQKTLLGIHRERFSRRNPEELRLEAIHLVQEPTETSGDFAGRIRIGIVVRVDIPAIRGDFPYPVASLAAVTRQNSSGSLAPPGMRHPTPMIAMGSCRYFSTASSWACNSSMASKARFNGESSVVFIVDVERSIGREITFAPVVLKAEPRLHHPTVLQSPVRGAMSVPAAALRPHEAVNPGRRRTCNSTERWR